MILDISHHAVCLRLRHKPTWHEQLDFARQTEKKAHLCKKLWLTVYGLPERYEALILRRHRPISRTTIAVHLLDWYEGHLLAHVT